MRETVAILTGLSKSYLFEGLTAEQLAPLADVATTRRLSRGEYLWRSGAPANEIYVVYSGELKDAIVDADGNEVIHFVHGPGMTFGEPGFFAVDHTRVVELCAVLPSVLIRLDRRDLTLFMDRYPSIKDRVLERLASNTRFQSVMVAAAFRRSLPDRVGLRLLELIDTNYEQVDGARATPKISQSTLAAMVGVSRENVNRALASLVADGVVRFDNGRYLVTDEAELRRRVERAGPIAVRRDRRIG